MASWAGFWGTQPNAYSMQINKFPGRQRIKGVVNKEAFRANTALFNALVGAASGSATGAIVTKKVAPITPGHGGGGTRTIESVSVINRNTTAADVTSLKEMTYNVTHRPATYPADRSGNGGRTW